MEVLNDKNFMLYAAKFYDNKNCVDILEFHDDLNRIKYLKRLFKKYKETGDIKVQLVLNHLIVIYNVFGIPAANKMIWYKIEESHWHYIKPFLVFLNYLPEKEKLEVPLDPLIVERLRKI